MFLRSRVQITLCLSVAATGLLFAQTAPESGSVSTFKVSTEFVLLDVLAVDKKSGAALRPVTAEDLEVKEDGVPQQITYISHDELPLSVVFLFDLTDTVRPVLRRLAEGAQVVLDQLRIEDEAAVDVFSSKTTVLLGFTKDHAWLTRAIDQASEMQSPEATFLNEDMYEAAEQSARATLPRSRHVLLFLTDGTSNIPSGIAQKTFGKSAPKVLKTEQQATDELLRSGATVSSLIERSAMTDTVILSMYANPLTPVMREMYPPGDIRTYAAESGGITMNSSSGDVARRMAALLDAMRSRSTIGYRPARPKPAGTFCRVTVRLTPRFFADHPEVHRKDAVVHVSRGYYR